jgi:DNA-directed RNA polymerase subunit RPC12/RpoP
MEANAVQTNEYRCDTCGFIYRSADFGGADLTEQGDDFACPECQATKGHFQINAEPDDLGDVEGDEPSPDVSPPPNVSPPPLTTSPTSGLAARRVYTETSDPSVSSLKELRDEGDLDPQPAYQRYEVWAPVKRSKLIESALMGLPLPRLYFAENHNESQEVVDGQQRLQAFFRFIDGEYALSGLKELTQLNGKRWSDLDKKLKNRLKNFSLSTVLIQKESDPDLRYDLFERLNTGATGLNEQELRNAVYRGAYNDFIYRLADLPDWRALHNLKARHKRMADAELVLRFMAFRDQTYLNFPEGSVTGFLNKQMQDNQPALKADLTKAEQDFKQAISVTRTVFGDKAFRKFTAGDETNPDGTWEQKRVLALADVQLWGMTRYDKGQLVGKADDLFEAALQLLVNPTFQDLITNNTSGKSRVERRFEMWKEMLDGVLEDTGQGPRLFARAVKQELWDEGRACARCGQEVKLIDDAQVDHKAPYSQGGKTEKENGQLMHRFCNLSKNAGS